MQLARPALFRNPMRFGRGPLRRDRAPEAQKRAVSDDLKLFATTFVAGFVFVSVLIA